MCITKCMTSKQLLFMKIILALSLPSDKLKNQSIIARMFNFALQAGLVLHDFFLCNFALK
jgi:hypothetical protein